MSETAITTEKKENSEVIYIAGNTKLLMIQSFLHELEGLGLKPVQLAASQATLDELPTEPIHIMLCLSDDIDTTVFYTLKNYSKKYGWHVYFVRNDVGLSMTEEGYMKETSPFVFTRWPISTDTFFKAYNWNERPRKRILVVDDDVMILRKIKALLQDTYEVYLISSGVAALEFLEKHEVELVLLDFMMPEMDGPEILGRLRLQAATSKLPVIFLTAKDDRESVITALNRKANGYILKSRAPNEIVEIINDFFRKSINELLN
ncbi:MAG: response regulator [Treponema sp.]|nr:response regulator [Treponema sp.]